MTVMRLSLGLLFVLPSVAASAAGCRVDPFRLFFGQDSQMSMVARSGRPCGSTINWHGGGASAMTVEQPPANGVVTTPSVNSWRYVSRPGFTGKDRFVLETSGVTMGRQVYGGTSNISVSVEVVP